MWFSKKPREIEDLEASCCRCGLSEGVKLVTRPERVGCLITSYTYCNSCLKLILAEEKEYKYKKAHFCNRCQVKFTRPYSKNRKYLLFPGGFNSYWMNLCGECYDVEAARIPKDEEVSEPWGSSTVEVNNDPW
jgi:hypothetical protein